MAYELRVESKTVASFLTTRSRNRELWFVNNEALEGAILGYLAKYSINRNAKLYAAAIEGSHTHIPAHFPEGNRAAFMRDLNSSIARAVPRHTKEYKGGGLWEKRYSQRFLPNDTDIEDKFFYTVLQPVQDGLVEKISDFPGYNCFHDAIWGIERKYKVVRWADYNKAKRYNKNVHLRDYTEIVPLKYERLPGYEDWSQKEYAVYMQNELERRRLEIVAERREQGLGFLGRSKLLSTRRGSSPKNPEKARAPYSGTPVSTSCTKTFKEYTGWYADIRAWYIYASNEYRAGRIEVDFPPGTYPPPRPPIYEEELLAA